MAGVALRPIRSLLSAVLAGGVWGAVAGWWTPRGPLTTPQALASLGTSVAIGLLVGWLSRSRWAILAAPAAFALVFELVRLRLDGPTVDSIHVSTYGLFAFATGRVFHALLSLLPMAMGAAMGAGIARLGSVSRDPLRSDSGEQHGWLHRLPGRLLTGATALALIALLIGLVVPARTEPIAGGVAELTTVTVGGRELGLMIRGQDSSSTVLLFLAGGPGGSELGAMRRHLPALEASFIVATLDQRGTGTSYSQLDPTDSYTLDGAIADVVAVTEQLRERFGRNRILLMGQSWGSLLGVLAVTQRPDLYSGFVGVGQMVDVSETDRHFYDATLDWARQDGNQSLIAELERIGPPPYDSMLDYETALSYEHQVWPYDHSRNSEGEGGFSENFLVEEYTLLDKVHLLPSFLDTFAVLYPQLQTIDFRQSVTMLEVPVYFVQGAHEAPGRAHPFDQWYSMLRAPTKDRVTFATSGHRALFEQPDEFVQYLTTTVLPDLAD